MNPRTERVAVTLVAACLVPLLLVPHVPQSPYHWDEVQLAYGVDHFDLRTHSPHPPGYVLFIGLGRALRPLFGSAALSLRMVSVLALLGFVGAVVRALPTDLSRARRWAWAGATVAVATVSPLAYQYGVAGLSYASEGACWTALLLWFRARPRGRSLVALSFCIGLAGGGRQTLTLWGLCMLALYVARTPEERAWRRVVALAAAAAAGVVCWFVPLLWLAGGLQAYRDAGSALLVGNIWQKSVFVGGLAVVGKRLSAMAADLWAGVGLFAVIAVGVLVGRLRSARRGAPSEPDPLAMGSALAFLFYLLLIYDSRGYMLACVLPLLAYAILGAAEGLRGRAAGPGSVVALGAALCFPVLPRVKEPDGGFYGAYILNDSQVRARAGAVRGAFSPVGTVLVTSREYWNWGLRHVGEALPEFTTVQLQIDGYFTVGNAERPYLTTSGRRLWTSGPNDLDLATVLAPGQALQQVVYMVPWDVAAYVDASCQPLASPLAAGTESLIVLRPEPGWTIRVTNQRLVCVNPSVVPAGSGP